MSETAAPGQFTVGGGWNRLTNTITGTTSTDKNSDLVAGTTCIYTVRACVNGAWGGYVASGVSATAK